MHITRNVVLYTLILIFQTIGQLSGQSIVGTLQLYTNIPKGETAYVVADFDYENPYTIGSEGSIDLLPGEHRILVSWYGSNSDHLSTVKISEGDTTVHRFKFKRSKPGKMDLSYSVYPRFYWQNNLLVVSEEGSNIFVNDQYIGTTQSYFDTSWAILRIRVENDEYGSREKTVRVYKNRLTVARIFANIDTIGIVKMNGWMPGMIQIRLKNIVRGTLLAGGIIATTGLTIKASKIYFDQLESYDQNRLAYLTQTAPELAMNWRMITEESRLELVETSWKINAGLLTMVGISIANWLDLRKYKSFKSAQARSFDPIRDESLYDPGGGKK